MAGIDIGASCKSEPVERGNNVDKLFEGRKLKGLLRKRINDGLLTPEGHKQGEMLWMKSNFLGDPATFH